MKTAVKKRPPVQSKVKTGIKKTSRRGRRKKNEEDLEEVWRIYKKTQDENLRNVLIEKHMPLVKYISERLLLTLPKSIELDDLISAGVFGLMDAIDGFDIERGIKFKTYCTTRIRGSILDELRSQDWVPRLVRLKAHQINKALKNLAMNHGREPTDYEMAKELGITMDEYSGMVDESSPKVVYSLSDKWDENNDDESVEKVEMIEDKNSINPVENLNQKDVLLTVTKTLSKKEKLIIIMYYYEGLTMREIGNILSLTESRVCQIHSNVMSKLKLHLDKVKEKFLT
ncbi:MAG: FliA/WhiG family RNA polymerase sigma factor [Planctomycetota bacterium]|jgi:RNA polymerase sigma factor for flagellar operon FliA